MRFCCVGKENLTNGVFQRADVYLSPFSSMGEIDYQKEIKGESEVLENLARLSRRKNAVFFCGCQTNLYGVKKKSIAVAERGKLLGICDQNFLLEEKGVKAGEGGKVFYTSAGKIGVAVGEDALIPENVKSLSFCGSDVIVCVKERFLDSVECAVLRANAFLYGVPIVVATKKALFVVNEKGKVAFFSEKVLSFDLLPQKEYRVVTSRLRGFSLFEK